MTLKRRLDKLEKRLEANSGGCRGCGRPVAPDLAWACLFPEVVLNPENVELPPVVGPKCPCGTEWPVVGSGHVKRIEFRRIEPWEYPEGHEDYQPPPPGVTPRSRGGMGHVE
jgi:hypothetical protein